MTFTPFNEFLACHIVICDRPDDLAGGRQPIFYPPRQPIIRAVSVPGWTAGSLCASTKFRPYWDPMLAATALCWDACCPGGTHGRGRPRPLSKAGPPVRGGDADH